MSRVFRRYRWRRGQGIGHEGIMGWINAENHHDRYPHRPSMVHLRHRQSRLEAAKTTASGNARVSQGQARSQTSVNK